MAIESVVVESLVSKISELLAGPVIKQLRYMFCFNNFVQEFNEQVVSLALALYRLQDAVDVAKRNVEVIEIDVNTWLEEAKNEMEGVNRLEKEGKNGKCFTWCPKWIRLFKLSKALEKKTDTLRKLEEKSKEFQKVSHKAPLQDIEFLPSKEFTTSESSKEAFEQIMKALKDDNINMIGLYGMGGVGKTTLVREVGRRAKESQLFDVVLLATDRMAESLGLDFDVKTIEGRAGRLWQRLETIKKLLVILDDVWKNVNLKEIGIPFGDDHRGCKVLLTTRRRGICSDMECQQRVLLRILSENEAWTLFKINAGLRDEDFNLNTMANKVARECQGLPIALVTVGRALRGKSVIEWEVASTELKNSEFQHMEQNGEEKNAYACLKLSYDYLKHEKTKLCFLLCCLFPEDYDIPIEDLTRYAVGYGLYQDVVSIEDARKQVHVAIKTLKDCCMLFGTETEKEVKMHDLVRDVAIQIASSKEHGFMVKAGIGLKEWPMSNKSFEGCKTISLMGNKLAELPEGLVCPQLKVLLLELDNDLKVPERFFEGMKEIEVLSLEGGCLSLQSLEFSSNLQSLLLIDCKCNDLISLRKLQRLKILGFIGWISVEELPDEIGELKELRLLDVTGFIGRIPVNLIGRLKKLEELLIGDHSFEGWGVVGGDSSGGMNASLTELNSLSHLAVLSLKIPRVECILRDFVFPRLLKYDIVLGDLCSRAEYPTSTRLYLHDISAASLNAKTFEQLFPTVSNIHFIDVEGLENIALSSDQMTSHGHGSQKNFFQSLEDVEVKRCRDIHTLFPAKWQQALNNLTSVFELGEAKDGINEEKELLSFLTRLELKLLPELECIWKGPTRHVSLRSLIHLELRSLDKLTFIFTPHLAQSLVHLETLKIDDCSGLKHLIGEKDDEREIIPESLGFLKLKTLFITDCDQLEYVFPVSMSQRLLNLEEMVIEFGANLKQIFYSGEGDVLTRDGIINFPQLRELLLLRPKNFTAQLPSLQVLAIEGHEELGDFLAQVQVGRTGHELSLLTLEKLDLESLPDMRCIWKGLVLSHLTTLEMTSHGHGSQKDFFQRLEDVEVNLCGDIRTLFPAKWRQALNNLTSVEIRNCESLEVVFELGEAGEGSSEEKKLQLLSSLTRLDLSWLPELKCIWKGPTRHVSLRSLVHLELQYLHKLTFIFTPHLAQSLVHLETLKIDDCSGLKRLIGEKDDEREIIPESLGFPKLKSLSISDCDKLEDVFPVSVSPSLQNLEQIRIYWLPELKCIWKGPTRHVSLRSLGLVLSHLTTLKVSYCHKLTHVFTGSMVASLVQLQRLDISGCEELEQIIAKDNDDEKDQILSRSDLQSLCFPNLSYVNINGCNKLRSLFPVAMAAGLPKLETLDVSHSSQLLGVFGQDDHASPVNVEKQMVFPNLSFLRLHNLPSIVCFSLGCDDFLFPCLEDLMVNECPKLTTQFANKTNVSMSAESEVYLKVAEDSSIGCSEPIKGIKGRRWR
ncbi:disease resistance protein [Salix suchowensis]|nr:disease resistance protein [Salix suchowensis]